MFISVCVLRWAHTHIIENHSDPKSTKQNKKSSAFDVVIIRFLNLIKNTKLCGVSEIKSLYWAVFSLSVKSTTKKVYFLNKLHTLLGPVNWLIRDVNYHRQFCRLYLSVSARFFFLYTFFRRHFLIYSNMKLKILIIFDSLIVGVICLGERERKMHSCTPWLNFHNVHRCRCTGIPRRLHLGNR